MGEWREVSRAIRRQDVGDTSGGRSVGVSGNAVGYDLHRETEGNPGTVGDTNPTN